MIDWKEMFWTMVSVLCSITLGALFVGIAAFKAAQYYDFRLSTKTPSAQQWETVKPTASMLPCIGADDQFTINYNYSSIKVGDIIKYRHAGMGEKEQLILHRVVYVLDTNILPPNETLYIVQGDANPYPDPWPVPLKDVLGPVQTIKLG